MARNRSLCKGWSTARLDGLQKLTLRYSRYVAYDWYKFVVECARINACDSALCACMVASVIVDMLGSTCNYEFIIQVATLNYRLALLPLFFYSYFKVPVMVEKMW